MQPADWVAVGTIVSQSAKDLVLVAAVADILLAVIVTWYRTFNKSKE